MGADLSDWSPPPAPPREPLVGRTCRLVPLDADAHAGELFEAYAEAPDATPWTYLPYGPFDSLEAFRSWLAEGGRMDDPLFFTILVNERPAGLASYLRIQPALGSIEVGHIHYAPRLQRTVAATEAMFLLMRRAFELGYRRYEWKCDAANAPSRRAAQRLGLSFEGVFRQAAVVKGKNRDTAWYAAIDGEWPALKAAFEGWLAPENFDADGRQRESLSARTAPILVQRG